MCGPGVLLSDSEPPLIVYSALRSGLWCIATTTCSNCYGLVWLRCVSILLVNQTQLCVLDLFLLLLCFAARLKARRGRLRMLSLRRAARADVLALVVHTVQFAVAPPPDVAVALLMYRYTYLEFGSIADRIHLA